MQTQIQNTVTVHIRNMCCQRCIDAVNDELFKLNLRVDSVKLGEAVFDRSDKVSELDLELALSKRGFFLLKDREEKITENVRSAIYKLLSRSTDGGEEKNSLSDYLSEKVKMPYRHLSEIFKRQKGISVEKYFILQKIEKAKDLVENSDRQFSEIADSLGYSSLQHLSTQFKNVAGMTMQQFRRSLVKQRAFIDMI